MALLGYKQRNVNFVEYLCGGTIITDSFILTAAHCLSVGKRHELVTVRVGEHNLQTEKDCATIVGVEHCSEKPMDLPVMQNIQHPDYDHGTLKNDIALVKVRTSITFTDYVQPVCLPFGRNLENTDLAGQKFTISGWGKTESRNVGGSPVLQFAFVQIWNQSECNKVVPPEVQPITENQICANGRKEDACKGDSGGPLFNASLDANDELRNFQVGIVSFASTVACGIEDLPAIYTRIDRYLIWIVDNIK
ncbi:melanization protease 1-like [Anoplophora glabripennis]|uniref:melanization protease 1-like n=1 Tax=Anoplophora glabripennis TaxID=217634 RepID=UPI000C76F8C0|nr:melanization protease 1-like [Anoplophora glabripennis]